MKNYYVEFIGTFFLMLTIGNTVLDPHAAGPHAALAIGALLMVMVYAGGHLSGAHYNPAVTLAVWMRGRLPAKETLPYIVAQLLGALFAYMVVVGFFKGFFLTQQSNILDLAERTDLYNIPKALFAEFFFAFALVYVILNVATSKNTEGNPYYGLAIGATVMVGIYAVGPISGAAFNPAVVFGLWLMGVYAPDQIWILLVGILGGALLAVGVFKFLNPEDK